LNHRTHGKRHPELVEGQTLRSCCSGALVGRVKTHEAFRNPACLTNLRLQSATSRYREQYTLEVTNCDIKIEIRFEEPDWHFKITKEMET